MKDIAHPDIARRLENACDGNPDVPPLNFGRLKWFVDQLEKHGVTVAAETVRKWFAGETMPRRAPAQALARILKVDEGWLLTGTSPDLSEMARKTHNVVAGGAVNVVAGFIQMAGGHPSFPEEDDVVAKANNVNLYAIIRGAHYRLHVTSIVGERGGYFLIPHDTKNGTVTLGVIPQADFQVTIYELDWPTIEKVGTRKPNGYEVRLADTTAFRSVTSFAERL
ncbi:hypothetical protein EN780_19260 [Mesorhizobium sp. M4B.F.Ca.ET.089.01.1.1]|uniref:hypothetical protein n=1 Tax=Mesorhizobium sp. M4B.F.Ca.ET.089.01.1.1 TaxID=2496662 RepID=UPI000FE3A173|nr:hypothetical protein [Mesorhizobium sp. M4B.F.Ca.ET.089.01.1.1]RWX65021.1 hypothetical protein EN780_19260 [Mesorhizobium sp. M4B.F.Ca.ET.089.01.1.1]